MINEDGRIDAEIEHLTRLPYTKELAPEDDGSWLARIAEFPGCMSVGDTRDEALAMLDDAMKAWVATKLEDGQPIPQPLSAEHARQDWAHASRALAAAGDDNLVWPEFANEQDGDLAW